jgi:GT2 family glycosyltransferase
MMGKTVSVVITSYDRLDLLKRTIDSFNANNSYNIEQFIIIEDSGKPEVHKLLKKSYPDYTLILNEKNIGLVESIDRAYSMVTSDFIFHSEDDYEYYRPDFIHRSIEVLNSNDKLMQVWIRAMDDTTGQPILPYLKMANGVPFYHMGEHQNWYGFCFQCGLRKVDAYNKVKPYTQWLSRTDPNYFLANHECHIGIAYHNLGYESAILPEGYARHTGQFRSTCGNFNK